MVIGANLLAIIYEIGVVDGVSAAVIVHAMRAREKFSEVMRMPRTIKDILDHADELAKRFEDYEPSPTDERDPAVFSELRRAVLSRSMPNARSETRSNTRENAFTPGCSSAR